MELHIFKVFTFSFLFISGCISFGYTVLLPLWREHRLSFHSSVSLTSQGTEYHWIDTWTATPQSTDYVPAVVWTEFTESIENGFYNTTIRQTIQITLGAEQIRLRLSNAFGLTELPITNVTVAFPRKEERELLGASFLGSSIVDVDTLQTVTFSGSPWVTIPNGALTVSDPISFNSPLDADQVLTVTVYLRDGHNSRTTTFHRHSGTTSWLGFGDHTMSEEIANKYTVPHWFFIDAIEVRRPIWNKVLLVIGDSISDARGELNENKGWPQQLFDRMQKQSNLQHIAVANQAAGGNQLLYDGTGPNAASRVDRDILAHSGVGYVVVFEGINDIGHAPPGRSAQAEVETRLIHYYRQIITRVHAFGIPVFGCTILPFNCQDPFSGNWYTRSRTREETRLSVNSWIRNSGYFDAVIDFDAALRDPGNTTQMLPVYNSGDCLHPNVDGFRKLAANFPLELLRDFRGGIDSFG